MHLLNRKFRVLTLCLLALAVVGGCGEHTPFQRDISEGIIEYEVTYPELDSNNIMLEMLPDLMVMKFKKNKYKSELKTAAGIIEMSVLADGSTHTMYNLVKIFSDRYVLKMNQAQARKMTDVLPPFRTEFLDEWETIADAKCQKVLLDFGTAKEESYLFYQTSEIALEDPNWCTPFNEIKGVLLDYRIENYNMHMRLKAIRIIPKEIDDSEFVVGEEYEELTAQEFDALVVKNMEIFME